MSGLLGHPSRAAVVGDGGGSSGGGGGCSSGDGCSGGGGCSPGGVLHYKFIRGCAPQGFLLRPNPRNLVRY